MGHNNFTAIYDEGYHTGSEFDYANNLGIYVLVAIPGVSAHAPDLAFDVEHFKYNITIDSYTCPANEILTTNGNWYAKKNGKSITQMKHYKTSACLKCSSFNKCTKKTIKHASADVGLIFTAFNLRRIFNLIDHNLLKQYIKVLALYFGNLRAIFKDFYVLFSFENVKVAFLKKNLNCSLNHIYLLTD